MKKYCILFLLLAFCFGFIQQHHLSVIAKRTAVEAEQEYGESTVSWYYTGGAYGCYLQHDPPTEALTSQMTVKYGYIYASSATSSNGSYMAVFENDGGALGDQNGGCSDEVILPVDADPLNSEWVETTWSSDYPVLQPDTRYWICVYTDAAATTWYSSYAAEGDISKWGASGSCPDVPTNSDTSNGTVTVSNYSITH